MYKIVYYNITGCKDTKYHTIEIEGYDEAITQYNLLKVKYQYYGIFDKKTGKLLNGNLFL